MQHWEPAARQLGRTIAKLRKARGLTQEQLLGRLADKDIENYRKLETGKRNATFSTLLKVAAALDVTVAALFADVEKP